MPSCPPLLPPSSPVSLPPGDHLQLDGFTNGILSSVAGLASTLCPAAVPWLAEHTRMGYGALMVRAGQGRGAGFTMKPVKAVLCPAPVRPVFSTVLGSSFPDFPTSVSLHLTRVSPPHTHTE